MSSIIGRGCKVGLYINPGEGWMGGETPRWNDIKTMAQIAEDIGFESFWLPDRLQYPQFGLWEGTTMLSALAAVTSRIKIGSAVMRSIYRNPTLVAKIADSIDEISGGRFILGIGAGSNEGDNHIFGYPVDHPYSRFEEAINIIHGLLREGEVSFDGIYYKANDCSLRPRGPRPSGPPIMISAQRPKMMRLAARYADMWTTLPLPPDPDGLKQYVEALDDACHEVGRDPSTLEKVAGLLVTPLFGIDEHPYGESVSGGIEHIEKAVRKYALAGYSHIIIWPYPNSPAAVEALAPVVAALNS